MAKTYTEKTDELGWKYVEALDSDKPETVIVIPIDEANADYQAYLNPMEHLTEIPTADAE